MGLDGRDCKSDPGATTRRCTNLTQAARCLVVARARGTTVGFDMGSLRIGPCGRCLIQHGRGAIDTAVDQQDYQRDYS